MSPDVREPVRVLLVDDQTLVRQGIRSLLAIADGIEVVGEAGDGQEALERIADLRPDVVLLDLRMPLLDGIGVLKALPDKDFRPPVLVLTTFDDDELVLDSLRLGARGYQLKDVSLDELVNAIETLAAGGRLVQPAVTEGLLQRIVTGATTTGRPDDARVGPATPLTEREREVLRLLAGGYSNREIASALHLAEGTVKNHVSSLMLKLGVRDRTRAVLKGFELGLVQTGS
jgi:DNA-binding NarL/FixJ family response regulator